MRETLNKKQILSFSQHNRTLNCSTDHYAVMWLKMSISCSVFLRNTEHEIGIFTTSQQTLNVFHGTIIMSVPLYPFNNPNITQHKTDAFVTSQELQNCSCGKIIISVSTTVRMLQTVYHLLTSAPQWNRPNITYLLTYFSTPMKQTPYYLLTYCRTTFLQC